MEHGDFWSDQKQASLKSQNLHELRKEIEEFNSLLDLHLLIQTSNGQEQMQYIEVLDKELTTKEQEIILSGKYDHYNAFVSISAGTGGTDAQDWAAMLLRMYTRYANNNNYKVSELDVSPGMEAGIKSVTILIKGKNAYGKLKGEHGVHRLVRISPFSAKSLRHTSFALAEITPEILDEKSFEIPEKELKINTFRAGGHGGQSVQKTESAVRITHLPTNIVVSIQNERSQMQNKETAMKILRSKLIELRERRKEEELLKIKGGKIDVAWGRQIRSYVLQPYTKVTDHRTNYETSNVNGVLEGELDGFIEAYLKYNSKIKIHG